MKSSCFPQKPKAVNRGSLRVQCRVSLRLFQDALQAERQGLLQQWRQEQQRPAKPQSLVVEAAKERWISDRIFGQMQLHIGPPRVKRVNYHHQNHFPYPISYDSGWFHLFHPFCRHVQLRWGEFVEKNPIRGLEMPGRFQKRYLWNWWWIWKKQRGWFSREWDFSSLFIYLFIYLLICIYVFFLHWCCFTSWGVINPKIGIWRPNQNRK